MSKRRGKVDARRKDIAFAMSLGWSYCGHSGSGHLQFTHPKAKFKLTIAATPSEFRSALNTISWVRRNTPTED